MIPERIQHNILVHINGSRTAWRSVSTCSVQAHFWMGMDGQRTVQRDMMLNEGGDSKAK